MQATLKNSQRIKDAQEHRDVLLALQAVLASPQGKTLFKYLFKNLEVGEPPAVGYEDNLLMEKLGFLRCGNSIYKLACEADVKIASELLCNVERERYAEIYRNALGSDDIETPGL